MTETSFTACVRYTELQSMVKISSACSSCLCDWSSCKIIGLLALQQIWNFDDLITLQYCISPLTGHHLCFNFYFCKVLEGSRSTSRDHGMTCCWASIYA